MNTPRLQDQGYFRELKESMSNTDALGNQIGKGTLTTCQSNETERLDNSQANISWRLSHDSHLQDKLFQTEKLATLGTFAAGIAHDINNPLYVMIGLAENILDEQDSDVLQERVQSIVNAGKRIQRTCRNITQYARATSGMDLVNVDVTHALNEAINIAQYACPLLELSVVRRYTDPLKVLANPEELLQVFVNLMTNAIQAMKGTGILTLSSWREERSTIISISDTGCGITTEHLEKIFQPFFTTKPSGEGTGLGLHNVKNIIKKYRGHLSVQSQQGKGTSFLIDLPSAYTN